MLTILNYNENKVKEGVAKCILENSFGCPVDQLTFYNKVNGFEAFMRQNRRATAKAVHISINFHPDEKLSEEKLQDIAKEYMDRIGFGRQPYLVYQHFDAGHPHIHVVTTKIQKDGSRINLFYFGKYKSEPARKEIELKYGLVQASGRKQVIDTENIRKVVYGKTDTKRNIANVVISIMKNYRYSSLPEFNAILSQFNIVAERGSEKSRMFEKKGLRYRILDSNGKRIGVPIKASTIRSKPTLSRLELQFRKHEEEKPKYKDAVIKAINDSFGSRGSLTKSAFVQALSREGIYTLFRQNEEGRIYGVTFVDNKNKVVFNGSDLGKAYSAKALTERLTSLSTPDSKITQPASVKSDRKDNDGHHTGLDQPIKDLMEAKQYDFTSPDAATRRRRKKRKRGHSI